MDVGAVKLFPCEKHGKIHIGSPAEFKCHVGLFFLGDRFHPAQSGDPAHCRLKWLGHEGLDLLRSHSLIPRDHGESRVTDIRQQVYTQLSQRNKTEKDDGEKKH